MVKQVISVMYNLVEQGGGITRVSLARTQALARTGALSRIALFLNDDKLDKTYENLVAQGRISSETNIVNLQRWFAHKAEIASGQAEDKAQSTLDHLKVKVKKRVDYINNLGVKVVRYLTATDYVFLEEFYSGDGTVAMVTILCPGKPVLKFNSLESLHAYWLKLLSEECLPCFLISDALQGADTVCMVDSDRTYRILMMHSNHLLRPHTVGSVVAPKYDGVIRGIPQCDSLVVLTRAQLKDLNEQFPFDRYTAIGNPVGVEIPAEEVVREENLAVVVARLHTVKRIKNIIRAFAKVVAKKPDARLEIWGSGEQEEELRDEINSLGMQDSIKMMGFATDVSKIFRRASVSLAMSVTEGFGVSFAESLAYGTPLVSINTNYGPREIVTSGEDGFIVESEKEFVEKTILLLSDKDLVASMGEKGKVNVRRFSDDSITKLWLDLFEKLESKRAPRQSYAVPSGPVIQNTVASKFGWIYLPATTHPDVVGFYKQAKVAVITDVSSDRKFLDESTDLISDIYEVDEMVFDGPKEVFRFRLMKNGDTYKGIVAGGAVKFILA
ncbi:glycosyltransferase [Pseudomonas sp. IT-P218]|uniref:glycosyltransferase n=1 Tax=Pseudomonas sp. IT-P218 TaxID=3026449 RepID=UPI0039E1A6DF